MEEHLASLELRYVGERYVAIVKSETEGEKELAAATLDELFRELTMDLEFLVGNIDDEPMPLDEEEFENFPDDEY